MGWLVYLCVVICVADSFVVFVDVVCLCLVCLLVFVAMEFGFVLIYCVSL